MKIEKRKGMKRARGGGKASKSCAEPACFSDQLLRLRTQLWFKEYTTDLFLNSSKRQTVSECVCEGENVL